MRRMAMLPLVAAAVMVAAACGEELLTPGPTEAAAQEAPAPRRGERTRAPRLRFRGGPEGIPLARLLERREELGLSAEQVSRLEAVSAELREVRERRRAALEEVREILSAEQEAQLRARRRRN